MCFSLDQGCICFAVDVMLVCSFFQNTTSNLLGTLCRGIDFFITMLTGGTCVWSRNKLVKAFVCVFMVLDEFPCSVTRL